MGGIESPALGLQAQRSSRLSESYMDFMSLNFGVKSQRCFELTICAD
jgi:hypothetical protein